MKIFREWVTAYVLILGLTLLIAHWGSRTVTAMVENRPVTRKNTLVIDAGHGGVDGGATSCTGVLESQLNLQIALRLEPLLQLLGYSTRMIRREDISVYTKGESIAQKKASDLKQRVQIVNETEGAVLLSIHQNQFSDSRYSGAQVFYAPDTQSRALAEAMQASMNTCLNRSGRTSKKSQGIYLMDHIEKPGILIECGFLSNPKEEAMLTDAGYQKKLCSVIAVTAAEYLSNT